MNANELVAAHIQRTAAKQRRRQRRAFVLEGVLYALLALATTTIVAGAVYSHAAPVSACGK